MIRWLAAGACLVVALGGMVFASFRGTVVAEDDTAQRVAALETVVSLHGAEIGALRTELELLKGRQAAADQKSTPKASSSTGDEYFRVDGHGMMPTIQDGEVLLIDTDAYATQAPERGDIIVFNPPVATEKPYVKRVIGLPGETIEIRADGYVYVDGQRLDEPYTGAGTTECSARLCEAVTVPEGQVYVLGDNRPNSADSRIFGTVDFDDIIGKVIGPSAVG